MRSSAAARAGQQVLAERVARVARSGRLRVDERRAVGLIHAAGTGVVSTQLALPVAERDPGLQQVVLEEQAFAMNHRELGAAMLADWGVPDALVQQIDAYWATEMKY